MLKKKKKEEKCFKDVVPGDTLRIYHLLAYTCPVEYLDKVVSVDNSEKNKIAIHTEKGNHFVFNAKDTEYVSDYWDETFKVEIV